MFLGFWGLSTNTYLDQVAFPLLFVALQNLFDPQEDKTADVNPTTEMKQTTLGAAATDEDRAVVHHIVDLDGANVNDDQFSSAEEYPDYNLVHD